MNQFYKVLLLICTTVGFLIFSNFSVSWATEVSLAGPKINVLSCSSSSLSQVEDWSFACYWLWDYGNEFWNDQNMCPKYEYSTTSTGCVINTNICTSGKAKATKVFSPSSLSSSDLVLLSEKLQSTSSVVKSQLITLWEYTCDDGIANGTVDTVSNAVVYGIYEWIWPLSSFQNHPEQEAFLEIPKTAEWKYLVLTAYEPVTWRLRNPNKVNPKKIIAVWYHAQKLATTDGSSIASNELHSYMTDGQYAFTYKIGGEWHDAFVKWLEKKWILFGEKDFYGIYSAKDAALFQKPEWTIVTDDDVWTKEEEKKVGPKKNIMNCSSPLSKDKANGELACYGVWDYGDEFWNDQHMCPQYGYSSETNIGCKILTPACKSGYAYAATHLKPTGLALTSAKLALIAKNLNSTPELVHEHIPWLWEYVCYDGETIPQEVTPPVVDPVLDERGDFVMTFSTNSQTKKVENVTYKLALAYCQKYRTQSQSLVKSCSWKEKVFYTQALWAASSEILPAGDTELSQRQKNTANRILRTMKLRVKALSSEKKVNYINAQIARIKKTKTNTESSKLTQEYLLSELEVLKTENAE